MRQGRSGGGLCYGYDMERQQDARGESLHGGRLVNEAEAGHRAAHLHRVRHRPIAAAIAVDLNRDLVPGPQGADLGAVDHQRQRRRGTGILNNELYVGRLVWNRLRYVKDPQTRKRVARPNRLGVG